MMCVFKRPTRGPYEIPRPAPIPPEDFKKQFIRVMINNDSLLTFNNSPMKDPFGGPSEIPHTVFRIRLLGLRSIIFK